jgi:hypothetical protein
VTEHDAPATMTLKCTSYSLVKRLKIGGELLRCDLPPPKFTPAYVPPPAALSMGKELVQRAFSGRSSNNTSPLASPKTPPRSVAIDPSVDLEAMLEDFYEEMAPEKIPDIPKVLHHFLTRDKHPGILLATLEDKYKVAFRPDGTFVRVKG